VQKTETRRGRHKNASGSMQEGERKGSKKSRKSIGHKGQQGTVENPEETSSDERPDSRKGREVSTEKGHYRPLPYANYYGVQKATETNDMSM